MFLEVELLGFMGYVAFQPSWIFPDSLDLPSHQHFFLWVFVPPSPSKHWVSRYCLSWTGVCGLGSPVALALHWLRAVLCGVGCFLFTDCAGFSPAKYLFTSFGTPKNSSTPEETEGASLCLHASGCQAYGKFVASGGQANNINKHVPVTCIKRRISLEVSH